MELKQVEIMANDLISFYCPEYTFKWDRAKRRFGYCSWTKKKISLSQPLVSLNSEFEVLDCILHEIAHALAFHEDHNEKWKQVAKSIGCNGERCYDNNIVKTPSMPYTGLCPGCNKTVRAYRRTRIACKQCCNGRYQEIYRIIWK